VTSVRSIRAYEAHYALGTATACRCTQLPLGSIIGWPSSAIPFADCACVSCNRDVVWPTAAGYASGHLSGSGLHLGGYRDAGWWLPVLG